MRIRAKHSHMNGEEFLLVHRPNLWLDLQDAIDRARFMPIMASAPTEEFAALDETGCLPASNGNLAEELQTQGWTRCGTVSMLVRERVAIEWQTGDFPSISQNVFANLAGLFLTDVIDVGIQMYPLQSLRTGESESSSCAGAEIFPCAFPHRAFPPVPLVMIVAAL